MRKYSLRRKNASLVHYLPHHVCKLKKSLYELKQAHKAWYERLAKFLTNHVYVRGRIDKNLFVKKESGKLLIAHFNVNGIVF